MAALRTAHAKWIRLGVIGAFCLGLSVAIGRGAYAKTTRARECSALSDRVNPVLDEIRGATRKKHDGATYRAAARRYAELAASIPKLTKGELSGEAREYVEVLEATAQALTSGAAALEAKSSSGIGEARRELERLVRKERVAVGRIETYCRAK